MKTNRNETERNQKKKRKGKRVKKERKREKKEKKGKNNKQTKRQVERTSVSMPKSGCQFSGGMILTMPYFAPSSEMARMYSMGSLNSSGDGVNVGASVRPCGRNRLGFSLTPAMRLSTVDMSRDWAFLELSGAI